MCGFERDRVGARDASEAIRVGGIERGPGAECAVHVQPDVEVARDVGDRVERVDGAGVRRTAAGDDGERQVSGGEVSLDRATQRVRPHAERIVHLDLAQVVRADAELLDALLDRGMAFRARVGDEPRTPALQPFRAQVPARALGGAVARGGERVQRRRRAAGQQQAEAALGGKSHEFHDPATEARHQEQRRVVVAVEPGVHRRRDRVGEDRDRRRRRVDPAVGSLVPDRDRPGHDLAAQELQDLLGRQARLRHRQRHQPAPDLVGHDAIDRLGRQGAQVLAEHLDGARAEAVEIFAVLDERMHGRRHTNRWAVT